MSQLICTDNPYDDGAISFKIISKYFESDEINLVSIKTGEDCIRSKYSVNELPVIMVTAKYNDEDIIFFKLGANEYIN